MEGLETIDPKKKQGEQTLSKKKQLDQQIQDTQKSLKLINDEENDTVQGQVLQRIKDFHMDLILHGIQLIVINDSQEAQIPLLEIEFNQSQATYQHNVIQTTFTTTIQFGVFYFNAQNSRWEPLIDTVG